MGCVPSKDNQINSDVVKKALLIGINYRGKPSELNGCINDTENLKTFLIENKYFDENDMIMMNDFKTGSLYPTKSNILKQLDDLIIFSKQYPKKEVHIIVTYSGHGSYTIDTSGDEEDGFDEMICPIDYIKSGFIVDDYIKSNFIDKLPSNVKLFMIIDACHSGTMCDLKYEYDPVLPSKLKTNTSKKESDCEVILLSGARDIETAADAYIYDLKDRRYEYQGALTASFIANYSHNITYQDLITNIRLWLKTSKYNQIAQMTSGKCINVNDTCMLSEFIHQ